MITVNVDEAKARLSELARAAGYNPQS